MPDLMVRTADRFDLSMPAKIRLAGDHVSVVRIAAGAPTEDGWVLVDLVDLSRSGFGFVSPVFLPKLSLLQIQIPDPFGQGDAEPLFDGVIRVRRVLMTDGRPAYLIGTSFESSTEIAQRQMDALMQRCASFAHDPQGGGIDDA